MDRANALLPRKRQQSNVHLLLLEEMSHNHIRWTRLMAEQFFLLQNMAIGEDSVTGCDAETRTSATGAIATVFAETA
jgi:hypothetical protein